MAFLDQSGFQASDRDAKLFSNSNWTWGDPLDGWQINQDTKPEIGTAHFYERFVWSVNKAEKDRIIRTAKERRQADAAEGTSGYGVAKGTIDLSGTVVLREHLIRFPSAPIYKLSPEEERHSPDREPYGFHTLRILQNAERETGTLANHVYLINHGLNELPGMDFYYEFAGWIVDGDPESVCLILPFPGHMTRFPTSPRLTETPLDRYMVKSSELFRHYLRHLIETQWLLSMIAPRTRYSSLSGALLIAPLGDGAEVSDSRQSTATLASEIRREYNRLLGHQTGNFGLPIDQAPPALATEEPLSTAVDESIASIRISVGWIPQSSADSVPQKSVVDRPAVHVVGYSLGGFVAQSVFMTWPFLVASCTTICSGGALRDLAPIEFSHPEEWQTLVHSLRYWLDKTMITGSFAEEDGQVLGMRSSFFEYLLRVFYEIFEQDYRASYQTRQSEYLRRLLFVVGGHDPIVKPKSVLEAAPPEGANIISVADLSHFLASRHIGEIEVEQREFWLPEVARILGRFANEADRSYQRTLSSCWRSKDNSTYQTSGKFKTPGDQLDDEDRLLIGSKGELSWPIFEKSVDSIIARTERSVGFLFVMRNEIPSWMLPIEYQIYRAKSLHHSEDRIRSYLDGLRWRQEALARIGLGVVVILPRNCVERLRVNYKPEHAPPSAEIPMGEYLVPSHRMPEELVEDAVAYFRNTWLTETREGNALRTIPQVWEFDPGIVELNEDRKVQGVLDPRIAGNDELANTVEKLAGSKTGVSKLIVGRLPDTWTYVITAADTIPQYYQFPRNLPNEAKIEGGPDGRHAAVQQLIFRVARMFVDSDFERGYRRRGEEAQSNPDRWLQSDMVRVIRVARSRNNPRYRGTLLTGHRDVRATLVHSASAALRSKLADESSFSL
jgi:hypothetical protein